MDIYADMGPNRFLIVSKEKVLLGAFSVWISMYINAEVEAHYYRDRLWAWADVCLSGAGEYTPSLCALSLISDSTQYLVTRKFLHRFLSKSMFEGLKIVENLYAEEVKKKYLTKMTDGFVTF